MLEIERRYLCRVVDDRALAGAESHAMEQGYLSDAEPAVRIRAHDGEFTLTVKAGRGRVRTEVEAPLPLDAGTALLELCGARRLAKVRHRLGRWEIDVYGGALAGLVVAEIELTDADEPPPAPPACIQLLRELTDDGRFTGQRLAALAAPAAAALVAGQYEGTASG